MQALRWSLFALSAALGLFALPLTAQQADPPHLPAEVTARYVDHYVAVESELRRAPTSELSPERLAARQRAIELLGGYREAADFGINTAVPGARVPHFRDDWGRHCAVAHLMDRTGASELVDAIAATQNTAWFSELAERVEVREWADSNGLTLAELTRMHGPGFGIQISSGASQTPSSSGGQVSGTTVAGSGGGISRTSAPSRRATKPQAGECSTTPTSMLPGRYGVNSDRQLSDASDSVTGAGQIDSWWIWWELNKSEFLELNRLQVAAPPLTGTRYRFGSNIDAALRAEVSAEALPPLLAALADRDAGVRARAAVAYARIAGGKAVPALLPLLDDASIEVRHAAILGLGATGSPAAVPALLHIAGEGRLTSRPGQISAWARPLALTALGLGRRHGLPDSVDDFVADMLIDTAADSNDDVAAASLVYDRLSRNAGLDARALAVFRDEHADPVQRCRATEALGLNADGVLLPQMTSALSGPDLEVRRSAALALGGFVHPLIAPRLQTAFELEEDPLTRGFILLALGRQGGTGACDFLRRTLDHGPANARPWAALSLGLMARTHNDDDARRALREALDDGPTTADAGAFVLACGIAREPLAEPYLRHALVQGASPRLRMTAALSLAMIDAEASRALLRERLTVESSPLVKVGLAQALGSFGESEDAALLLRTVRELTNPELQSQVASAMGFHGTGAALTGLLELATDTQMPDASRAAAWDALGLLLDKRPGLMLADISSGANFAVFPDWVTAVVTTQTL